MLCETKYPPVQRQSVGQGPGFVRSDQLRRFQRLLFLFSHTLPFTTVILDRHEAPVVAIPLLPIAILALELRAFPNRTITMRRTTGNIVLVALIQ